MPDADTIPKRAYTMNEAAVTLGIRHTLLYTLVRQGAIASIKIGGRRVIPAAVLDAYLERLMAEQADYVPDPKIVEAQARRWPRAEQAGDALPSQP